MKRFGIILLLATGCLGLAESNPDPAKYGLRRLTEQLTHATPDQIPVNTSIDPSLGSEGFLLSASATEISVAGGDSTGVMYGLLDAVDQLRLNGGDPGNIAGKSEKPRFPFRAVKFNLPWSAYRDHPVVHQHDQTCRDLTFWEAYLDMMAENRFNRLTLWNLHPFPYMFRSEKYPEACDLSDEELAEWQTFWHGLFRMAHERGIKTYMVWWNIFVSPAFSRAHDHIAEYSQGLSFYGDGENNELVDDYNRECVTQLINEYPELDGIGISLGERMLHIDEQEREQWILDIVVRGMRAADHQVEFIHRAPFTSHAEITRKGIESMTDWKKPIWVELKFNASHGHSALQLAATHGGKVNTAYWNPPPENYKMTWMMRNEDFVMLRWGQPDFIRNHIAVNGHDFVGGYYVGSETYIPAVEYRQKRDDRVNWTYAFERDWLFYKTWGRLLYNPKTSDQLFVDEYAFRYGKEHAETLFKGMAEASRVPLLICSFLKGGNDPSLTAEQLLSSQVARYKTTKSIFIDVNQFIHHPVLDPAMVNIDRFVADTLNKKAVPSGTITPLDVADQAYGIGKNVLNLAASISTERGPIELEIADLMAWGHLSKYFALKIRAAVELELFRKTQEKEHQEQAVALLTDALGEWKTLSTVTDAVYNEVESAKLLWIETPKKLSWKAFIEDAEYDIEIARKNIRTL